MHIFDEEISPDSVNNLNPTDKWILSKLNNVNKVCDEAYLTYDYATVINTIEDFVWHDFCDEYIEAVRKAYLKKIEDNHIITLKKSH